MTGTHASSRLVILSMRGALPPMRTCQASLGRDVLSTSPQGPRPAPRCIDGSGPSAPRASVTTAVNNVITELRGFRNEGGRTGRSMALGMPGWRWLRASPYPSPEWLRSAAALSGRAVAERL